MLSNSNLPGIELVIQAHSASLNSGPGPGFSAIKPIAQGAFVTAVGHNQAGDWYLVRLEDGVTRGWGSAADAALFYPAVTETISSLQHPD